MRLCCAGRGEKRSRPPSPSRPERSETSLDRGGPPVEMVANGRPLPDDGRSAKRLAVNLLSDVGSQPRAAAWESERSGDARKRSRSPRDAKLADLDAERETGPPGLSLSPDAGRGPLSATKAAAETRPHAAAAGSAANGSAAATKVSGDQLPRPTGKPAPASGALQPPRSPCQTPSYGTPVLKRYRILVQPHD